MCELAPGKSRTEITMLSVSSSPLNHFQHWQQQQPTVWVLPSNSTVRLQGLKHVEIKLLSVWSSTYDTKLNSLAGVWLRDYLFKSCLYIFCIQVQTFISTWILNANASYIWQGLNPCYPALQKPTASCFMHWASHCFTSCLDLNIYSQDVFLCFPIKLF